MNPTFKKVLKISLIIIAAIILLVLAYFIYIRILIERGDMVKWEGKWYTKEQIQEKFPPQYYEAPSKNTPEEVYARFREFIMKNDINGAIELITEKRKEKYRKLFEDEKNLEKYKTLPPVEEVKKSEKDSLGNFVVYSYKETIGEKIIKYSVEFEKNIEGYWEISGI